MATMKDFNNLFNRATKKQTDWGTLIQTDDPYVDTMQGNQYGGSGLIFLGREYTDYGGDAGGMASGASYAQLDPYLAGASQHGAWKDLSGQFNQKLDEVIGFSVDAYQELQGIYDQIGKGGGAFGLSGGYGGSSTGFNAQAYVGSGDNDTAASNRAALESGLQRHAQNRAQYDNLVSQFNSVYQGAIQKRDADAAAHAQRLADLEAQRQAADAAAARNRAWASNMNMQNRQNENVPETVTSGTASEGAGAGADGAGGDDKRRRGRGSLSSNLGLNA